jgi:hypothetical protein
VPKHRRDDLTFSDSETGSDVAAIKRHKKHISLFPDSDDEEDDMDEDFWQVNHPLSFEFLFFS